MVVALPYPAPGLGALGVSPQFPAFLRGFALHAIADGRSLHGPYPTDLVAPAVAHKPERVVPELHVTDFGGEMRTSSATETYPALRSRRRSTADPVAVIRQAVTSRDSVGAVSPYVGGREELGVECDRSRHGCRSRAREPSRSDGRRGQYWR